jgi:diguanylate cyclase (GGDEF)-like protein
VCDAVAAGQHALPLPFPRGYHGWQLDSRKPAGDPVTRWGMDVARLVREMAPIRSLLAHVQRCPRSLLGAMVGVGCAAILWAGHLLVRSLLEFHWPTAAWAAREITAAATTYIYIAVVATVLFAAFGLLFGFGQDQILARSLTDALTGLPNRRHLDQRLVAETARVSRSWSSLAVLFVDLDRLKRINDTMGHHAGDSALRAVGEALRRTCRTMDFAARWGGDEFVVLAPSTTSAQAVRIAQRIQRELPRSIDGSFAGLGQRVSVSIGIASVEGVQPVPSADTLVAHADRALYEAKSSGGNRIAVAARSGRFEVHAPTEEKGDDEDAPRPRIDGAAGSTRSPSHAGGGPPA